MLNALHNLSLGLHAGKFKLQEKPPDKKNIQHFINYIYPLLFLWVILPTRIRIQPTKIHADPDPTNTEQGSKKILRTLGTDKNVKTFKNVFISWIM